ncbi:hypothetical protein [Nonomuraea cavernae]|uniref:hypothetical protein n=1 Tax=Nonomuraea cavernae TaxID=2045107 RepID=UPI0033D1E300
MPWLVNYCMRTSDPRGADDNVPLSFTTPAHGDSYDFDVTVRLSWTSAGKRQAASPRAVEWDYVTNQVRGCVRTKARAFSPFQPGEAEVAVNKALDRLFIDLPRQQVLLTWSGKAEISSVADIRNLQQKRVKELYQIDSDLVAARLRAEQTHELRLAWEAFLTEATTSWYARYAVQLAENPKKVAEVLATMLEDRENTAARFLNKLDAMVTAHERSNVFDMVIGSDSALRQVMQVLGLSVPPRDPDPLLGPPPDVSFPSEHGADHT